MKYIMPKNVKKEGKTEVFPGVGFYELICIIIAFGLSFLISFLFKNPLVKIIVGCIITFSTGLLVYGTTRGMSILIMLKKVHKYFTTQQRYFSRIK